MVEDAKRKFALLGRINTESGAAAAEAETAGRLQKALMARHAIKAREILHASSTTVFRLTGIYWQRLLEEFGLRLNHFANRGSVAVGKDKLYIKLDTNQWRIEESFPGGWKTTAQGPDVESLRRYLNEHAPRNYSSLRC